MDIPSPPDPTLTAWTQNRRWYLGLDLGAGGMSASLMDCENSQLYPICWVASQGEDSATFLRLPSVAYLTTEQLSRSPEPAIAVGDSAVKLATRQVSGSHGVLLGNLRHALGVAIPYLSTPSQTWEPMLQWSEQQALALEWVQQATIALLHTLTNQQPNLTCTARELEPAVFATALSELAGVVVGCPAGWSDTFRFNLREAVLATGLVSHPDQIFFIEDAVAALLAELPLTQTPAPESGGAQPAPSSSLEGGTLVISAGATVTELLLVDLPSDLHLLTEADLYCRSTSYAGNAIDQDILCQVFYPSVWGWRTLGTPTLDLPLPGEPDPSTRYRLQQRLRSNVLGQSLLRHARRSKLVLQQQETHHFEFEQRSWTITQQDLHHRVIVPYIQLLNRELNTLLAQTGLSGQSIHQVICTGGTTTFPAIADWLRQKLPNASLIQHASNSIAASSRIANGLATLPLFPQVLNSSQHQYSDYFLLRELLRLLPSQPLALSRILQLLEAEGIHSQVCQQRVLNLLEGQLPAGILPTRADFALLSPASRQNPDYQTIATTPLFDREGNQVYRFNPEQRSFLTQYLTTLLNGKHQTLNEPLSVNLGTVVAV